MLVLITTDRCQTAISRAENIFDQCAVDSGAVTSFKLNPAARPRDRVADLRPRWIAKGLTGQGQVYKLRSPPKGLGM
jgi:hypothetical protein